MKRIAHLADLFSLDGRDRVSTAGRFTHAGGSRLDARWQEVWPRHENKSRARCGSRASGPHLFSRSHDLAVWRAFYLRCRAVVTAVAVGRAVSCGTQRASPVNAHISTCQSDGADLSPANLSCPGVYSARSRCEHSPFSARCAAARFLICRRQRLPAKVHTRILFCQ